MSKVAHSLVMKLRRDRAGAPVRLLLVPAHFRYRPECALAEVDGMLLHDAPAIPGPLLRLDSIRPIQWDRPAWSWPAVETITMRALKMGRSTALYARERRVLARQSRGRRAAIHVPTRLHERFDVFAPDGTREATIGRAVAFWETHVEGAR